MARAKYYPAFDYLRIALATIVAVTHSGLPIWRQAGDYSVQVFFALSGLLIGGILVKSDARSLPKFYFNRVARIWLPYFTAILIIVCVSLLKDDLTLKWFEIVFYYFTFVYNFFGLPQLASAGALMPLHATGNHFWSICAEEQFYLAAPVLIVLLPGRIGRSFWLWLILFLAIAASPYFEFFAAISGGVLAAISRAKFGEWQLWRASTLALAVTFMLSFALFYFEIIPYRIGAPISAVALVLLFARPGPASKVGVFLGGMSFPMYLNHWLGVFIANAVFKRTGLNHTAASEVASVVIALGIAAVLYVSIDRLIKKYRDQYFTEARGGWVAVSGFVFFAIGLVGGSYFTLVIASQAN